VLQAAEESELFLERGRWQALSNVQRAYLDILNREKLWDRQTARLVAIKRGECRTDHNIYLVGTVDLNPVFREILEQVADKATAVVFADESLADHFDDLGCLQIDTWEHLPIDIPDEDIRVADQPGDQAKIVSSVLYQLDGQYGVDQIAVSVPDPRLISHIGRALSESGVKIHDVGGMSISNTRPYVLLELLGNWIADQRFESFAELIRHPDMYAWLLRRTATHRWLEELDNYQNSRLPFYISTDINDVYFGGKDRHGNDLYAHLELAYSEIYELIQPVVARTGKPLDQWAAAWKKVLVAIYLKTVLDRNNPEHRRTIRACQSIVRSLIELEQSGHLLRDPVQSQDAIQWALELCGGELVADPAVSDSLPLTGWLDTPWEDTPVTIVTNFNEGYIPSSASSNLFLPNSVRGELGLLDNRRRYARDAYALSLVLNSRKHVALVVGRRDEDGQPQMPSRLLMMGDPAKLADRAIRLFSDGEVTTDWCVGDPATRPADQQFIIPQISVDAEPINSLRVTDFKAYLECPYRFYLNRVLGLERLHDRQDEMDGRQFGQLIHDVVENFGRSELKDSDHADDIEKHIIDCLNRFSMARYGRRPIPSVQIQLEQARIRLRRFAKWQAEHRRQGYRIFQVEKEKTRCVFEVDGEPFEVRGQIDRIDVNDELKIIGVYDYKTDDKRQSPRDRHQTRDGRWIDLQLPLYFHLLGNFDLPDEYRIETGLILIAKDTDQPVLELADWSSGELESANAVATRVMRQVRSGQFWPPNPKPRWRSDVDAICQTGVFQKWEPGDEDPSP
ncbi:MAG: PD-(D/E)XK nuclease family protein, partial [Pirellulaceae bacterium]